jgi:hypothetical protein
MLIVAAESLAAGSNAAVVAGASAQLIGANTERNGLSVSVSSAATNPVYLLLGAGTASATNFHYALPAGATWDGMVSGVLWRGAVQYFGTGAQLGVVEV